MNMMITNTCFKTLRVYVSNPTDVVITMMDCISIWGGCDNIGNNYKSWEIAPEAQFIAVRCAGKCGIILKDFDLVEI